MTNSTVKFEWKRSFTDQQLQRRRWAVPVMSVLMLALSAMTFSLSAPAIGVLFLAWASLPVTYYMPRRLRLRVAKNGVELRRQPLPGNAYLWLMIVGFVGGFASLIQIVIGDPQVWRLFLPCIGMFVVAALCARLAYRARGPVLISAAAVSDVRGYRISLHGSQIEAVPPERGGPLVRILPVDTEFPSASGYLIPPRELGLDFNTVVSTLQQLVDWSAEGREASPAEIAAMITAAGPENVGVGESVDVVVDVADAPADT